MEARRCVSWWGRVKNACAGGAEECGADAKGSLVEVDSSVTAVCSLFGNIFGCIRNSGALRMRACARPGA